MKIGQVLTLLAFSILSSAAQSFDASNCSDAIKSTSRDLMQFSSSMDTSDDEEMCQSFIEIAGDISMITISEMDFFSSETKEITELQTQCLSGLSLLKQELQKSLTVTSRCQSVVARHAKKNPCGVSGYRGDSWIEEHSFGIMSLGLDSLEYMCID